MQWELGREKFEKSHYRASPPIPSINVGLPGKEKLHNVDVAFTGGDVESGATVEIDAIDVDSFVEQILNTFDISSTGHEKELHSGV